MNAAIQARPENKTIKIMQGAATIPHHNRTNNPSAMTTIFFWWWMRRRIHNEKKSTTTNDPLSAKYESILNWTEQRWERELHRRLADCILTKSAPTEDRRNETISLTREHSQSLIHSLSPSLALMYSVTLKITLTLRKLLELRSMW